MATEAVYEIETLDIRRRSDDRMMIRGHLVKAGPGATWIYLRFSETRHTRRSSGQNFFNETSIKVGLEAGSFFRVVPGQQNSFSFATEMKACGHVDDHGKALW